MTTSQKLWLGFGTLTAVLILSGLAILVRVGSVRRIVSAEALVTGPRRAATDELETHVVGYVLDVRAFAQTGDPALRRRAAADEAAIRHHELGYRRLARTPRQQELAGGFGERWQATRALCEATLSSNGKGMDAGTSHHLLTLRTDLERFLNDEMQAEAAAEHEAHRGELLSDVGSIADFVLLLLITGGLIAALTGWAVTRGVVKGERELWAHRERLRVMLASIGDAVIATDLEGRVTYLNAVAEELTGWSGEEAEGLPLGTVFRIVNETTREPAENPALRALREGGIIGLANHTLLIAKDGTECPIDDSAAPIRDERGNVLGCVLIFRDFTERRDAVQVIRESESRKAAILNTALDCIITIDHEGKVLEFNPAAERTFGHPREAVVGKELAEVIIPPALRERHRQGLAHYLATGEGTVLNQRLELAALRSDGSEFPVELAVTRIAEVGLPVFTAYLRDISERCRAGLALHESEEFSRGVLESTPDCVKILDAEGRLVSMNANGQCVMEIGDFALFQGKSWWELWPEEGRKDVLAALDAARAGGDGRFRGVCPTARGTPKWWDVAVSAMRNADGEVIRFVSVSRDVTEQKRMEDQFRQMATDLSEADHRKDEFLAMLAHELRNPLAPVSNALQHIRRTGAAGEATAAACEMMERQVAQMVRLVDDLLDVSRVSRGKIELRLHRVELASAVNHALEAARSLAACREHQLIVTLPSEPVYLHADPMRLAQVVGNLLSNACKFTDLGGVIELVAEVEPPSAGNGRGYAVIRVRDNGIGIAPEQLFQVFDMFMQLDTSLERSTSGLGIGLTLVKELVEMHGGTVEARSEGVGRGSEFLVRLPALSGEMHERPLAPAGEPARMSGLRILVVDDNRDSAESLAELLEIGGNETHTAFDGLAAVAAAERLRPDAIIMDVGLPKQNGHEACRHIREQVWGKGIVMIALTGWGQDEDRRKSSEAGFDSHMVKPADYETLTRVLSELLPPAD